MKKNTSNVSKIRFSTGISMVSTAVFSFPTFVCAQIQYTVDSHITPVNFTELLLAILNVFIVVATPIIVLFIIYSGFLYVTARGNAEQTQQATRSLTYAIIGGVLILGAVAISQVLSNVVASFTAP